ncbi:hypothetical protein CAPTEDRAFT_202340, partial [Capitella teleta]
MDAHYCWVLCMLPAFVLACNYLQVDLSPYANLQLKPFQSFRPMGHVECMIKCSNSEDCPASAWNEKTSKCLHLSLSDIDTDVAVLEAMDWDLTINNDSLCSSHE